MKHYYLQNKTFTEDITDADYAHTKRVSKDFEISDLGNIICVFKAIYYC